MNLLIIDPMTVINIRDYIYMDTDKIKSIISQIDKGIIENQIETKGKDQEIEQSVDAGIPLFRAKIGHKYVLDSQTAQTRSLHDYVYNILESSLNDQVRKISSSIGLDQRDKFEGDSFIFIERNVQFLWFDHMLKLLKNMDNLLYAELDKNVIAYVELKKQLQQEGPKQKQDDIKRKISQLEEIPAVKVYIPEKASKDLAISYLELFQKGQIILKITPEKGSKVSFYALLKKEYLRDEMDDLVYKYGSAPKMKWKMLAQISAIPKQEDEKVELSIEGITEVSDIFENIMVFLSGAETKLGLTVKYPDISLTPIAIYRGK
jgi:hypothetical protein